MEAGRREPLEMIIRDVRISPLHDSYRPVTIVTDRGDIACRYYRVPGTRLGAIWVGGIVGDWDTPARNLYPDLCQQLMGEEIASLRIRYRDPTTLDESVLDVLAGINYLQSDGIDVIALTGYSFGGAVVIQAGVISQAVRTIVTLATQTYGAQVVRDLPATCSILLIHGTADRALPPSSSEYIYRLAHEPKRLILYEGADHTLDGVADEVHRAVHAWIVEKLREIVVR